MAAVENFIIPEYVHTAMTEQLMQNAQDFTTKSNGAIVPVTEYHQGDTIHDAFFLNPGEMNYRNPTTQAAGSFNALEASEQVGVKLYWDKKISFPMTQFKRYMTSMTPEAFSQQIAETLARNLTVTMINKAAFGIAGALHRSPFVDNTTDTLSPIGLSAIDRNFGDNASRLATYFMHSISLNNLGNSTLKGDSLAIGMAYEGNPATLGKNVYATDSLGFNAGDTNGDGTGDPLTYVHGLVPGAIVIQESERQELFTRIDDSETNLKVNITMEGAFTLKILGYAWDASTGIVLDDAVLGAPANWSRAVDDVKAGAGVSGRFREW